jgi:protein O-GlcNAc transferase
LGAVRVEEGRYAEAIADYRAALSRHTGHVAAHRNLLAALLYDPTCDLETLHDEHLAFALAHRPRRPIARPARTGRGEHLRVAYLSSDFCDQPVGRNVVALFEHRDRTAIEVFGYSDVARPDGMTERFRSAADGWRSTVGLTDEMVAELIRADRIDILVILAGRFGDNRPLVAVHRPAPVIVSFHDGATSGLSEVDFWLTDDVLHPAGSRERFTETLLPVPCFYCYPPISEAPPPARRGGHARVVFGSFRNPAKINDRVVSVWGKLLGSIDGSSLILKYHDVYGNAGLRRRISALFAAVGIECERIVFSEARDSTIQHLSRYEEVDVALDTFPFTGATTTFEAIWMGVPVVTLAGDRFVGRMSASILAAAGLGDFITSSPDRYVEVAADIARDAPRRAELRASLRGRILHGPLCDGHGYARSVEAALRSAWNTIASAP